MSLFSTLYFHHARRALISSSFNDMLASGGWEGNQFDWLEGYEVAELAHKMFVDNCKSTINITFYDHHIIEIVILITNKDS